MSKQPWILCLVAIVSGGCTDFSVPSDLHFACPEQSSDCNGSAMDGQIGQGDIQPVQLGNECTQNTDCDDDQCWSDDYCVLGKCKHAGYGGCGGGPGECEVDSDCDDANVCTTDSCFPLYSSCQYQALPFQVCEDGNTCFADKLCTIEGVCAGTNLCDDDDPCTYDYCDDLKRCAHEGPVTGCNP